MGQAPLASFMGQADRGGCMAWKIGGRKVLAKMTDDDEALTEMLNFWLL